MRYVALRKLTYVGQDGATYAVLPGEPVPEFASWPSGVRHANIHAHMVRDTHALAPTVVGQELRMTCYGQVSEVPASAAPAAMVDVGSGIDASMGEVDALVHICPHCDHKGFALKNSLMQHIKRKH